MSRDWRMGRGDGDRMDRDDRDVGPDIRRGVKVQNGTFRMKKNRSQIRLSKDVAHATGPDSQQPGSLRGRAAGCIRRRVRNAVAKGEYQRERVRR